MSRHPIAYAFMALFLAFSIQATAGDAADTSDAAKHKKRRTYKNNVQWHQVDIDSSVPKTPVTKRKAFEESPSSQHDGPMGKDLGGRPPARSQPPPAKDRDDKKKKNWIVPGVDTETGSHEIPVTEESPYTGWLVEDVLNQRGAGQAVEEAVSEYETQPGSYSSYKPHEDDLGGKGRSFNSVFKDSIFGEEIFRERERTGENPGASRVNYNREDPRALEGDPDPYAKSFYDRKKQSGGLPLTEAILSQYRNESPLNSTPGSNPNSSLTTTRGIGSSLPFDTGRSSLPGAGSNNRGLGVPDKKEPAPWESSLTRDPFENLGRANQAEPKGLQPTLPTQPTQALDPFSE